MADFAIATLSSIFAQEKFADAFMASAEKVLVILENFFMIFSPRFWDMRIISLLQPFVKRFFVILYKKTYSVLLF